MTAPHSPERPPPRFLEAVAAELSSARASELKDPARELSHRYRAQQLTSQDLGAGQVRAYLATRVPATFAAAHRVLSELARARPGWRPSTVLDIGAGPGTASWAAREVFGTPAETVCVEHDEDMVALGRRLAGTAAPSVASRWVLGEADAADLPRSDLVLVAYVLGELSPGRRTAAVAKWWDAALGALVLVEAGTPRGAARIIEARSALIASGASVLAPCPHERDCPMAEPDWCHFSVRLQRSRLHRDVKDARLAFEDEKYSYLIASPDPPGRRGARLVRSPHQRKGHVRVMCCDSDGLGERVISKREGDLYRRARSARWGDALY